MDGGESKETLLPEVLMGSFNSCVVESKYTPIFSRHKLQLNYPSKLIILRFLAIRQFYKEKFQLVWINII